jgi:hypothetical protein
MTTTDVANAPRPDVVTTPQDIEVSQEVDHEDLIHEEEDYDERWDDGVLLAAPPPRPGYYQRWVRIKIDGAPDMRNLIRRKNQRYTPRLSSTAAAYESTMFNEDDVIGNEEMVLMERPIKLHERQAGKQRGAAKHQMEEIRNSMFKQTRPGDGFGSIQYDDDRTDIQRGRPASIADDPAL